MKNEYSISIKSKLVTHLLILLISFVAIKTQAYQLKPNSAKITWTAFKTPKKVGVNGSFDEVLWDFKNTPHKSATANQWVTVVEGAAFKIKSMSVNSGNKERDAKLVQYFFNKMTSTEISGQVLKVDHHKNKVQVELNLNGIKKVITFDVQFSAPKLVMTSSIDVLDFKLKDSLAAIHEACKTLHEGKTWSDVNLKVEAELE